MLALSVRGICQNPFRRSNLAIYLEFLILSIQSQIIDLPVIGAHPTCSIRFWYKNAK